MNNPTSDDLLDELAAAYKAQRAASDTIESIKAQLASMHADGIVGDELSHPALNLKWVSRTSWVYSPAVRQTQDFEKLEGLATKRVTSSWTIQPNRTPESE